MNVEILHQPDSAIARVTLESGEELVAEAGCMVAMSGYINASTTLRQGKGGGILGGLKRLVAGESLFLSVFRSPKAGGEVGSPRRRARRESAGAPRPWPRRCQERARFRGRCDRGTAPRGRRCARPRRAVGGWAA